MVCCRISQPSIVDVSHPAGLNDLQFDRHWRLGKRRHDLVAVYGAFMNVSGAAAAKTKTPGRCSLFLVPARRPPHGAPAAHVPVQRNRVDGSA